MEIAAADQTPISRFEKNGEQAIQFIKKGVQKMDQIIRSLLRLLRIDRDQDPTKWNDLNTLIHDIRDVCSFQLKEKSIEFHADELPRVRCRKHEINQVFSNLIANAINYMGDKLEKKISVRCVREKGHFLFSVADTGIGIPDAAQEKVFTMFSRLGEIAVEGEGMGLTIAQKIIHSHHGKMTLESVQGKGSTFFFTLPCEEENE